MKKRDYKKLALMGLTSGLLLSQHQAANAVSGKNVGFQETPWEGSHWETANRDQPNSPDQDYESPESAKGDKKQDSDPNQSNMSYHLMTEQELLLELNDDGRKMYSSLDAEGKALSLKVASMMCAKTNECKGLNACMTDTNTCAGKGDCKGKGKCAISDKNLAVKLVYDKMAAKRAKMLEDK